jgi:hypothetical protein
MGIWRTETPAFGSSRVVDEVQMYLPGLRREKLKSVVFE